MWKKFLKWWYGTIDQKLVKGYVDYVAKDGSKYHWAVDLWLRPCNLTMEKAVMDWKQWIPNQYSIRVHWSGIKSIKWTQTEEKIVTMLATDENKMRFAWDEMEIEREEKRLLN